jgi:hypothetical protein
LARRVNYIKSFKEKFNNVPTLLVDSGNLLSEDRTKHGDTRVDGVAKNEWMLKAQDQFRVDIVNLSAGDMSYLAKSFTKSEFARSSESQPVFKRFISANIKSDAKDFVNPPSFMVREIPQAHSSKPVRVAFIGLSEMSPTTPSGFKIADPIESAKRVVPEVRRNAEIVIVLARLQTDVAARLAREVQGLDVIITGTGEIFTPSFKLGETLLTFTPLETRMVGELRFYINAEGKLTYRDRFISLDEGVADDAEALQLVSGAKEAKNNAYKESQALLMEFLSATKMRPVWTREKAKAQQGSPAEYISANACAECHLDQFIKWSNSKHVRATDSLMFNKNDFDAGCLQCHATGKKANELPKFTAVQCEQCHGPGSNHALKPVKGYGRITDLKSACLSCHTQQTSPNFDPQAAWLKIKH